MVCHLIHDCLRLQDVALTDTDELHLQGDWPVGGVEVEHALLDVYPQESGHILAYSRQHKKWISISEGMRRYTHCHDCLLHCCQILDLPSMNGEAQIV